MAIRGRGHKVDKQSNPRWFRWRLMSICLAQLQCKRPLGQDVEGCGDPLEWHCLYQPTVFRPLNLIDRLDFPDFPQDGCWRIFLLKEIPGTAEVARRGGVETVFKRIQTLYNVSCSLWKESMGNPFPSLFSNGCKFDLLSSQWLSGIIYMGKKIHGYAKVKYWNCYWDRMSGDMVPVWVVYIWLKFSVS